MKKAVLALLLEIPRGRVVTYGQIAKRLNSAGAARAVGNILHANPDGERYPCHRVVNHRGCLSAHYAFGGREKQKERLEQEGVAVKNYRVDLKKYGWKEI